MALQNVGGIMRDLEQEERDYTARWAIIGQCADAIRHNVIASTCAKYELESDEFLTREQKAVNLLHNNRKAR